MLASHTERHEDGLGDREWRWGMGHEEYPPLSFC